MGGSMVPLSVRAAWPAASRRGSRMFGRLAGLCFALLVAGPLAALLQKSSSNPIRTAVTPVAEKPTEAHSAIPASSPPVSPPATPSLAIPLPDVAARSEDLKRLLRIGAEQLPSPDQLRAVQATLDERDLELQSKLKEVDGMLAATPSTLELREQENYWRAKQAETAALRRQL